MNVPLLKSLNTKILLIVALVFLVGSAVLSSYLYYRELRIGTESALDKLSSLTKELSMATGHFINTGDIKGLQDTKEQSGI